MLRTAHLGTICQLFALGWERSPRTRRRGIDGALPTTVSVSTERPRMIPKGFSGSAAGSSPPLPITLCSIWSLSIVPALLHRPCCSTTFIDLSPCWHYGESPAHPRPPPLTDLGRMPVRVAGKSSLALIPARFVVCGHACEHFWREHARAFADYPRICAEVAANGGALLGDAEGLQRAYQAKAKVGFHFSRSETGSTISKKILRQESQLPIEEAMHRKQTSLQSKIAPLKALKLSEILISQRKLRHPSSI